MATTIATFDYSALESVAAQVVRGRAEAIRILIQRTAEQVVEIGEILIDMKAYLPHGKFEDWIVAEFSMSTVTATRMMNAARFSAEKLHGEAFAPSVLYMLSAPSTPEPAQDELIERAKDGEKITQAVAKEVIERAKTKPAQSPDIPTHKTRSNSQTRADHSGKQGRIASSPKQDQPTDLSADHIAIAGKPIDASAEWQYLAPPEDPDAEPEFDPLAVIEEQRGEIVALGEQLTAASERIRELEVRVDQLEQELSNSLTDVSQGFQNEGEVWDKVREVEAENATLRAENTAIRDSRLELAIRTIHAFGIPMACDICDEAGVDAMETKLPTYVRRAKREAVA